MTVMFLNLFKFCFSFGSEFMPSSQYIRLEKKSNKKSRLDFHKHPKSASC